MIDVNFGNKTIIAGLAMALILAYGMVNFDSGTASTDFAFPKAEAVTHTEPAVTHAQTTPAAVEVLPEAEQVAVQLDTASSSKKMALEKFHAERANRRD